MSKISVTKVTPLQPLLVRFQLHAQVKNISKISAINMSILKKYTKPKTMTTLNTFTIIFKQRPIYLGYLVIPQNF